MAEPGSRPAMAIHLTPRTSKPKGWVTTEPLLGGTASRLPLSHPICQGQCHQCPAKSSQGRADTQQIVTTLQTPQNLQTAAPCVALTFLSPLTPLDPRGEDQVLPQPFCCFPGALTDPQRVNLDSRHTQAAETWRFCSDVSLCNFHEER